MIASTRGRGKATHRPRPATVATRRAIAAELIKTRGRQPAMLSAAVFPTLNRLLLAAEWHAVHRPKWRRFHFDGTVYAIDTTNLGRLIVSFVDGRPIVGTGPGFLWPARSSDSADRVE